MGSIWGYVNSGSSKYFVFTIDSPNDTVFFRSKYGRIVNILEVDEHVVFLVKCFEKNSDVFSYPCKSSKVGIVFGSQLSVRILHVHIREVAKCWRVKWTGGKHYIAKLLHE